MVTTVPLYSAYPWKNTNLSSHHHCHALTITITIITYTYTYIYVLISMSLFKTHSVNFTIFSFEGFSWDYDKAVWIDSPWSIAGGEIHLIALVGQSEEGLRPDSQCGLDFTQVRHNKPVLHQNARQFKSIRIESDLNFYQSNQPRSPFICHSIAWKRPQTYIVQALSTSKCLFVGNIAELRK